MSRGKNPSFNTIRILCGRSAGMCQFEGCPKRLFYDVVSNKSFNNSYVAHIIASNPRGPRGDKKLSHLLSDDINNLMLMCSDHHKLIDDNEKDYTVERLKEMKRKHEERIENLCKLFYVPKTELLLLSSPIKGKHEVEIKVNQAADAVIPDKQPASNYGIALNISSAYDYKSPEYWNDCVLQLNKRFISTVKNPFIENGKPDFSVFAIAPIPLIIKFGELLGDKLPCDVFQKYRNPDTWKWQSDSLMNSFSVTWNEYDSENNDVALVLSLTNAIELERVFAVQKYKAVCQIQASVLGVDCIKSKLDLSEFWHTYQSVCDEVLNRFGRNCNIHIYPAIPVSAAFELGRRFMQGTYPAITVFDECNGFFETIKIGG